MQGQESRHSGRLELTWTNKGQRLLSHEDGSYEWTTAGDYRTSEVRLLHGVTTVGEVLPVKHRARDNLLVRGDALHALTSLGSIPEFANEYLGKVKLVYIDPPFNTDQAFTHYDDALEHSVWLTMMRDRLAQIKSLLAPDGSVWLHLDDVEAHRARSVMDEVFGPGNFVATVVWRKVYSPDNRTLISPSQDYLLVYAKDKTLWKNQRNLVARNSAQLAKYQNPDHDPRGPWKTVDFSAQSGRATKGQFYTLVTPAGKELAPPSGRAWVYTKDRYEELVADNRVWFGKNGQAGPALKSFLSEVQDGVVPQTWWDYAAVGHNQEAKKEIKELFPGLDPFDTPKPERLMQRVLHIATNPGDIVLDCFAGSGTTAAVAHKMGRRWVTVEWLSKVVEQFTLPRLIKVVKGTDPGGMTTSTERVAGAPLPEGVSPEQAQEALRVVAAAVKAGALTDQSVAAKPVLKALRDALKTKDVVSKNWTGGGGFRVLDVAPSMFSLDEGDIYLSEWATGEPLAEAVAAQFGFSYNPEGAFAGSRGTVRLAVVDGFVNEDFVDYLVSGLHASELVEIYATGIDPDAQAYLKKLLPGSRLVKIPASIISSYRRANRRQAGLNWLVTQSGEAGK
ncbi:site-specific DNA-methyltransferase [Frigoribacterium sp. PhB118]|uniref:site-specific DNA-methyltransferase n=1 Tax=Frigoribacterium sp. PhB118 TaxID=2485175 RepID=UPI000F491FA9|nr:site-specific DNA-methyltransferase [Frigoribacterium sp. PhB118]ROS48790.1 adenine-specific DNA-methyltransferase [Frigoribacterium sp. PhB118]